jgi:PAS domain S-box-containing protein
MRVDADRLLHIFDSLDYHLAVYDREWRYTYVNEEAARILGRRPDELLGRSIWDLFPEAVGNQYYRELHAAVADGRVIHSDHFYAPFNRWFENHIYPLPDGVMVLARDVTEQRNAAEALRARDAMLRLASAPAASAPSSGTTAGRWRTARRSSSTSSACPNATAS